jgi:hypothetical protein
MLGPRQGLDLQPISRTLSRPYVKSDHWSWLCASSVPDCRSGIRKASPAGGQQEKDLDAPLFRPAKNNRTSTLNKHLDPGSIYRNIIRLLVRSAF